MNKSNLTEKRKNSAVYNLGFSEFNNAKQYKISDNMPIFLKGNFISFNKNLMNNTKYYNINSYLKGNFIDFSIKNENIISESIS